MLFKDKNNQIKYLTYKNNEKTKQRHFDLNTGILEAMNETITVFNHNNKHLKLNSNLLATIIFNNFFNEFENLTDDEKLQYIKNEILKEI